MSEGKSYKFLVRACNKAGDSPDLVMDEAIVAKNPFDPPGVPGQPEVSDWGADFADLRWMTPDEDGGSEITGYRIEVRNRDKRAWITAGSSEVSELLKESKQIILLDL